MCRMRLPSGCSGSASKASWGSVTASRISYSTAIAAAASRAVSGCSAATAAIGSPWWRTSSLANTGRSAVPRPCPASPGTSSCVTTTRTPGISTACRVSMDRIRARGCGERSTAAHSSPSAHRSAAYGKVPSVFSRRVGGRQRDAQAVRRLLGDLDARRGGRGDGARAVGRAVHAETSFRPASHPLGAHLSPSRSPRPLMRSLPCAGPGRAGRGPSRRRGPPGGEYGRCPRAPSRPLRPRAHSRSRRPPHGP